eukprot:10425332-Alexandrium_andersonii.AAC.1
MISAAVMNPITSINGPGLDILVAGMTLHLTDAKTAQTSLGDEALTPKNDAPPLGTKARTRSGNTK